MQPVKAKCFQTPTLVALVRGRLRRRGCGPSVLFHAGYRMEPAGRTGIPAVGADHSASLVACEDGARTPETGREVKWSDRHDWAFAVVNGDLRGGDRLLERFASRGRARTRHSGE